MAISLELNRHALNNITSPTRLAEFSQTPSDLTTNPDRLSVSQRISTENTAVTRLLESRNPNYLNELTRLSQELPPMPPEQRLGIVIPSYNEQETILMTLKSLAEQKTNAGEYIHPTLWGALIVINCPVTNDSRLDSQNFDNMSKTAEVIETFKRNNPRLNIEYIVVPAPIQTAGVGIARTIGHDLTALRSSQRNETERTGTMYLQTADADCPDINPQFIDILLNHIQNDNDSFDFYRQFGEFTTEDKKRYPLLSSMEMFWNETLTEIATHTDSAWTVGRGILMSLSAHSLSGGTFPFRFRKGVDEDIRMGILMRRLRGHNNFSRQGQINIPMFSTDPRREILVIGDLLKTAKESEYNVTRHVHDVATLLESYLNFHNTAIRGKDSPFHTDVEWLTDPQQFEQTVPKKILENMANSWRELIRTEVSLDRAKEMIDEIPEAKALYELFIKGKAAYPVMRGYYNRLELILIKTKPDIMDTILEEASDVATESIVNILEKNGIGCTTIPVEVKPPGREKTAIMPQPIQVLSTELYRQRLLAQFQII